VRRFIHPEGRVVVPERRGGTISEAQAYALLRAVWAGDEATFARVARWTQTHLSREACCGDHLLAWHWGPREDGTWGVLDANTASDADLDYALALVLAHRRGWRPPEGPDYLTRARQVAADIWRREVVHLPDGTPVLAPGNWHEAAPPYLLNPSYFFPAACRLLAEATGEGRWLTLAAATYPLLESLSRGLGGQAGVGLFPDWALLMADGRVEAAPSRESHFGWEAVRLPWRLAVDRLWYGREEPVRLLAAGFLPFFRERWQREGRLVAVYAYDGHSRVSYESPVLYAGVLAGALAAGDREWAGALARRIMAFYRHDEQGGYFEAPDNYYAQNWAWLGLALYAGKVQPF
jgi:endoglucanase